MQIIRVFPRKTAYTPTDPLAFVGDPPLREFRPRGGVVHVSCAFTWDLPEAKRLAWAWRAYYDDVLLGGPATGMAPNGFEPGRYVKSGVVFTSRGCNNHCPWCLVPSREGRLREYDTFAEGHIIQDNNFLACSPEHRRRVYAMLSHQPRAAVFAGGLDARLVTDETAAELSAIRVGEVFLAADTDGSLRPLETAVNRLSFLPRRKLRCYVLCAFGGETIEQARRRLEVVWQIGCLPFAQLFQPPDRWIDYDSEWRALAREWSRPAAMFASHAEATNA